MLKKWIATDLRLRGKTARQNSDDDKKAVLNVQRSTRAEKYSAGSTSMWEEEKTGVYVCYSIGDKFDEKLTPPLAPTTLDGMARPPTEPGIPHV